MSTMRASGSAIRRSASFTLASTARLYDKPLPRSVSGKPGRSVCRVCWAARAGTGPQRRMPGALAGAKRPPLILYRWMRHRGAAFASLTLKGSASLAGIIAAVRCPGCCHSVSNP